MINFRHFITKLHYYCTICFTNKIFFRVTKIFDRRIIETKQQHVKLLIAKISIIGKIEEYKSKKKMMIRKIARKFINRFLNLSQPTNNFKFTLDQIRDPGIIFWIVDSE